MRFVFGIIIGVLLTIGAAYVHDSCAGNPQPGAQDGRMVNWSIVQRNLHELDAYVSAEWRRLTGG